MTIAATSYATRTGPRSDSSGQRPGIHANGYRFGSGRFVEANSLPEKNVAIIVDGASIAKQGYELLTFDGGFLAWFDDILDAVDALKVNVLAGKVVRCTDRALLKHKLRKVRA